MNLRFDPDEVVYTSRRICRWVSRIGALIFSDLSVINREYGTPSACGPASQGRYLSVGFPPMVHNLIVLLS